MKAVCLISGGIDSPVAAHLMAEKGVKIVFLHAVRDGRHNNNVEKLVKTVGKNAKLYYVNHSIILNKIAKSCSDRYNCVLCKRALYKAAELLAEKVKAEFIITGESIGQVASQTLKNLGVLDEAVKLPVIRPLIGLNKEEIIIIAKKIGTYETSINISSKTCPFVPIKPATSARLKDVLAEESKLNLNLQELFFE